MRTETNIMPISFEIERHGEGAELIFRENITEESRERDGGSETVYTFDEYRMAVPWRDNLSASVEAAKEQWIESARAAEYSALAAEIREKRDKLLKDTDARMCFDRMGLEIPSGSTFTAWVDFLKGIAGAVSGEWARYRQALRDLPEQPGFPYNVEFPKPPEGE